MAKIKVEHVFDLETFKQDVDTYRNRWNITRRELARTIDISPSTLDAVWQTNIISLPTAVVLATVCDLDLNSYVVDFMKNDIIPATPVGRSKASQEKSRLANQAKIKAMRKLTQHYPEVFKTIYNFEREKVGLPPIK